MVYVIEAGCLIAETIVVILRPAGIKYLCMKRNDNAVFRAVIGKRHVFDM